MSRYPFRDYAADLLASHVGVYAPATLERERRRYDRMSRDLISLRESGEISTTSPALMTMEDVRVYLVRRRSLGFSPSEYRHELFSLNAICEYAGSSVVKQTLSRFPLLRPYGGRNRLPVLSQIETEMIILSLSGFKTFSGLRAAAMVAVSLGCGARTKELQFLENSNVDLVNDVVNFVHVKGEGTYGEPRMVPIAPVFHDVLVSYYSRRACLPGDRFFCSATGSPICDKTLRASLGYVYARSGVRFDFRILRRTFGQNLVNSGLDIESVSVLMGHSTTKTTENYYCRRSNADAAEDMRQTFGSPLYKSRNTEKFRKKGADDRQHTFLVQGLPGMTQFFGFCDCSPNTIGIQI